MKSKEDPGRETVYRRRHDSKGVFKSAGTVEPEDKT